MLTDRAFPTQGGRWRLDGARAAAPESVQGDHRRSAGHLPEDKALLQDAAVLGKVAGWERWPRGGASRSR